MIVLYNAQIINENKSFIGYVIIKNQFIFEVGEGEAPELENAEYKDLERKYLMPGVIDDQVHFREPGLSEKGDIQSESKAAIAGGVTSFMEMPNTKPSTLNSTLLEEKYSIAKENSYANYSFYMGASNDNLDELLKIDYSKVCGLKVFMGSSTGNMLVEDDQILHNIFKNVPCLIAVHCEDNKIIADNTRKIKEENPEIPFSAHPLIRSVEACYKSSSKAVRIAKETGARLHLLHLSTAKEMELLDNSKALKDKKITAEVCVHHLWFDDRDYENFGTRIKWNPAIKSEKDKIALQEALKNNLIDVVATDHAPHLLDEKEETYLNAPSGGPLVQHSLLAMLELFADGVFSLEQVVEKMCHNPSILYRVKNRGYIRKGYYADLVVVDQKEYTRVNYSNILYKCKWSPFEDYTFSHSIYNTYVNGKLVYNNGKIIKENNAMRLEFSI